MNHQELSSKVAEAFAAIANALPEMDFISSELYPVAPIQHTLAVLYTHVIDFCVTAVKWYEKATRNIFRKALAAIKAPWPLEFEHIVRQITDTTTRLREQAAIAHQAETRHMNSMVCEIKTELMRLSKARSKRLVKILALLRANPLNRWRGDCDPSASSKLEPTMGT